MAVKLLLVVGVWCIWRYNTSENFCEKFPSFKGATFSHFQQRLVGVATGSNVSPEDLGPGDVLLVAPTSSKYVSRKTSHNPQ